MSRRDQLYQAMNNVQGQVFGMIDQHVDQLQQRHAEGSLASRRQQRRQPNDTASTSDRRRQRRSDTADTLPLYSRTMGNGVQAAPSSVLNAAPGQAQFAADQLPQSRMANGTGREARAAAAALRQEQLQSGMLKTKHTFVSSGARVVLEIDSVPQKMLTLMGGTKERGRGAMKGTVTVHAQPNERVAAIRLKIKAVVRVLVPRAGTPQQPFALERSHPQVEPCVEKEVLLLQLESQLYDAKQNTSPDVADPTVLPVGRHDYPFMIDLPSQTSKGVDLPPSFVLAPLNKPDQVQRPQPRNTWESITSTLPVPQLSKEWASVKWYVKLTVERPGLLRSNERIFAPFVYLPPPPSLKGMQEHLINRLRLAAECDSLLRQFQDINRTRPIDLERLREPLAQWDVIRLAYGHGQNTANASKKKAASGGEQDASGKKSGGFLSRMLFGSQAEPEKPPEVSRETFSLHLPKKPFVFALRSGIPFVISRSVQWSGRGELNASMLSGVPTVGLFQRCNSYARGKGPVAGTTTRFVAPGRLGPGDPPVYVHDERSGSTKSSGGQRNQRTDYWLGLVDLPAGCTPCFETPVLTQEYFIGVRTPASPNLVHTEQILLVCPPSKPVRVTLPPPTPSQPPSRTATPNNGSTSNDVAAARRRRQASSEASSSAKATGKIASDEGVGGGKARRDSPGRRSSGAASSSLQAQVNAGPSSPAVMSGMPSESRTNLASEEKRAAQARLDEQNRLAHAQQQQQQQQQAASSSSTSAPPQAGPSGMSTTANGATAVPPPPPPRPNLPASGDVELPVRRQTSSATALNSDDAGGAAADETNDWQFPDDELTDLPPSYFEATGLNDD